MNIRHQIHDPNPNGPRSARKEALLDNANAANKKFRKELSSGIAALVLLSVLDRAAEPMYGYQIAKLIGAGEADVPIPKPGALYPVLRSLEKRGLLQSQGEGSSVNQ